ncbi:MAG: PspA/IM30 family protein [Clostridia bacterium]|nr:PspA/IM30 family protein [Clostridia bacterium]MBQ6867513.1 PspA/IM30 family protein [Clostridia bacterium]MBQ6933390.1 PspA/IM30 family protein [Clostridia bacterium]MBQ7094545.1 PspA/IM30 family protein [Clostridia bacterium]
MANILTRFNDIVKANVNALLDKFEDPAKMIDQYLRDMMEDLAEVKKETAGVMAEEARAKRLADANSAEVEKYLELAKKALAAGNDDDARVFLAKKQDLEASGAGLHTAYAVAHENAVKMRQMHDKLTNDINELKARREMIKAKVAVAKTQEKLNQFNDKAGAAEDAMNAFKRMEEKADNMLDKANAMADLNSAPVDAAKELEKKYAMGSPSVEDELAELKKNLGK